MYKNLKYSTIFFCAIAFAASVGAQNITVTSAQGQNITLFVNNNLLGSGVQVSNVKFNNSPGNVSSPQIGTFNANGYQQLMMPSGVIMTTGNVSVAPGPNNNGSASTAVSGTIYSDPQLNAIATNPVTACSTLDFDFVSVSPFINVNYCFASEEYPEYVCSSFNDVFAFFITGPDPQTGQTRTWNMAKIPHTVDASHPDGIPVTINAVNQGVPGSNGSTSTSGCYTTFSEYYVANHQTGAGGGPNNAQGVQYDGFTQKLSANATILPCQQYHMHISICNVQDNAYDSGVFLEANSFNSPQAQIHFAPASVDTVFRSHPRRLPLTLQGSDYSYALMRLQFGGTAVLGRDYKCYVEGGDTISTTHNFVQLEGDTLVYLVIAGTQEAHLTRPLSINIGMTTQLCENFSDMKGYDTLRCILAEDDIVRLRDTVINANEVCEEVGVEVVFSRYPLTFQWMPEDDIFFPTQQYSTASITESRTYHVEARDTRGNADTATVQVVVSHAPVGLDEVDMDGLHIYPNPAFGMLNVEAEGLQSVEVFDVQGALIMEVRCSSNHAALSTLGLSPGIYTVRATTLDGTSVGKVSVR